MPRGLIVVKQGEIPVVESSLGKTDFATLGYHNVLQSSTILDGDGVIGVNEDAERPFVNALDYRDNTKYSPDITNGSVTILISQSQESQIDYFAFAVHNGIDANLSGRFEVDSGDGNGYVTVAEFNGVKNNRPFLSSFTPRLSQKQRLVLSFTSKLFIGAIHVGKAIKLKCPAVGFQSGRYSSLDEVEQFKTEGNNFIMGRRKNRGFQTKATFRLLEYKDVEIWYEEFMNHVLDSKPLFFKWTQLKDETVYGQQSVTALSKLSYKTNYNTDISLEINGYA